MHCTVRAREQRCFLQRAHAGKLRTHLRFVSKDTMGGEGGGAGRCYHTHSTTVFAVHYHHSTHPGPQRPQRPQRPQLLARAYTGIHSSPQAVNERTNELSPISQPAAELRRRHHTATHTHSRRRRNKPPPPPPPPPPTYRRNPTASLTASKVGQAGRLTD